MGLFDRFRKRRSRAVSLEDISYAAAYFILPHYVFQDLEKLVGMCSDDRHKAAAFFYLMAARLREATPVQEDAQQFRWHHGRLPAGEEHFTLEYPKPPAVDLSDQSIEELMSGGGSGVVLAPYFSTVLLKEGDVEYWILGQAPMGGGTTIRSITSDGANSNHGAGPQPTLKAFLTALSEFRDAD